MRSHYQASVWNQAHSPYPDLPPLTEMEWMHLDGRLVPRLLSLSPIPKACREVTSCGCTKGCRGKAAAAGNLATTVVYTPDDQEYVHTNTSTCLYDKLMHSCFLPTSYAVCLWALQNVFLMWMDSDGTCGYNLIDELFIIENYTFCKQYAF